MTTQVDDSGLAFLAAYLATRSVTISVHTDDPGPTGANNELATGRGRNYARHTEAADGSSIAFNKAVTIYTPTTGSAVDATHIAFFDAAAGGNQLTDWFQYPDIAAPQQGQPVQIASGFRITV